MPKTWEEIRAFARGRAFTLWYRMFRPRVRIGQGLILRGKLQVRGPGRVILGDRVQIAMRVTLYTYSADAVIQIGDRVFLNGARFGCKQRIDVGERSILADCRVRDYDFHSIHPAHRNDPEYIHARPVRIEENVWVTTDCNILKGVTIGRDSTISTNSVVASDIPEKSLAGGNPAVVWKTLSD